MGYNLELKRSSTQQQSPKILKGATVSPQAYRSLKFQDKLKVENLPGLPYGGLHRKRVDGRPLVQPQGPKPSENRQKQWVKGKVLKDDELVKHMSNLPGYLQRMDGGENLQEKALNVGVLNWEHLEKWKCKEKRTPAKGSTNASSTSSNSSLFMTSAPSTHSNTLHSEAPAQESNQHSSLCSNTNSSHKGGLSQGYKPSQGNAISLLDFKTSPKSTLDGQKRISWTDKSLGKSNSVPMLGKCNRKNLDQKVTSEMGSSSTNVRNYRVSLNSKEKMTALDGAIKKRSEELQDSSSERRSFDQMTTSKMETSSLTFKSNETSPNSRGKIRVWNAETAKRVEKVQEPDVSLSHQICPGEHENIVLLFPRHLPQNSSPESIQLSEPRMSLDSVSEANLKSVSDGFSPRVVDSPELYSDIPHSCPLPCRVEANNESEMKADSVIDAQGLELPSDASPTSLCSNGMSVMQSEGKYLEGNGLHIKPTNLTVNETSTILEQETIELAAAKGRNPSPNRRFSFGLGRMGRSLSFKEGLAVPQLSSKYVSVKSGPVSSEASACLDNSNRDKANAMNRARSSPLRRLLDPLLKPKAANQPHSAETLSFKGNLNSLSFMQINASESFQTEKYKASTVHALLQLSIKNGHPLFKFAVDNSSSILVATMTNLTATGKDDSSLNYTFYSVNEIKKKSGGWMNQVGKGKSCGYAYNVVGQMKVSSSHFTDLTGQKSNCQFAMRESVLFGVELIQVAGERPKFVPNRELAAVVVKKPSEDLSLGGQQSDKDRDLLERSFTECLPEDNCSYIVGVNKLSCSTTVILPEGVHGLPNKGVPSPLIDRWRSGGSCDCGGWDVGCKLHVLSNQDDSGELLGQSRARPIADCFELFVQGGAQETRPLLSLAPFKKGIYSVDFKTSISLLQAFFICVTVISCQKSSDLSDTNNLSKERLCLEPTLNGDDGTKTPTASPRQVPAKYVPHPPLSPVGRV